MIPAIPLTPFLIVVMTLSLVIGVLNQLVQSGKILGQWPVSQTALPYVTIAGSFLGGVYGFFRSLPTDTALSASIVFYAVMTGLSALLVGAAPGLAMHHFGAQVNMLRPPARRMTPPVMAVIPPSPASMPTPVEGTKVMRGSAKLVMS